MSDDVRRVKPRKCPGCGKLVRVTDGGQLWSHSRLAVTVTDMRDPIIIGKRPCEWGGKKVSVEVSS